MRTPHRPPSSDRGLRKSLRHNEVLKGIDLKVQRGEVIAIIGKSGSGKSTLLRCINGLEEFQDGALTVDGKPLLHDDPAKAMRALRQHVGMIFQSFNLFPHLTVGRNVMLAPSLVKKTEDAAGRRRRPASCCDRVGLAEKFDATPDQLSGGQQQRVAIARALAMDPACCCATRSPARSTPSWWARCCAWWKPGRRRHDAADGHPRDELRAQGERPRDLHAPGPGA
jgi:polar amino acid transport system ATP-binding protein